LSFIDQICFHLLLLLFQIEIMRPGSTSSSSQNDSATLIPKINTTTGTPLKPSYSSHDDSDFGFGLKLDNFVLHRMMYILAAAMLIIVLYFGVNMWRTRRQKKERVYDVLPIHQLSTNLVGDSDSEDDVFDDAHRNLVSSSNHR
ncbi:hypothetical protein T05_1761, partial [Trichinella murrelli]